ncbi:TolC family outer membrane protein [Aquabacterium sp.]|uniref:TolC family outer membrane protein n=1 Tax=Aquabacterium sp. TaxID=1872578 RepID=UPI0035B2DBCC
MPDKLSTPAVPSPLRKVLLVMTGMVLGSAAQAESLQALYQAARGYDAAYLAAVNAAEAVQHKVDSQTGALRYPSVALTGYARRWHLDSSLDTGVPGVSYDTSATNKQLALGARYALFNRTNDANISQLEQSLIVADADLQSAEQDLIVRVTQAYFDVLSAQDVLTTAKANMKALSEQLALAKRNFEVGNATITDTREAQARYDLANAQVIAASNDLKVKGLALDQLVGRNQVQPDPLHTPVSLPALTPADPEAWVNTAAASPAVRKAKVALDVARLETSKSKAGHLPTVDLTAQVARLAIDGPVSVQANNGVGTTSAIGVELNMPLFSGFSVQNKIKQSLSEESKAENDLANAQRSVALGVRQAYFGVQSGLAQVNAYEAAESSAKLALEATQTGYKVGVRINKDVLDAQTSLSNTQKDLYKARYDVLVAGVKLRQATGTLKPEDLQDLNRLLASPAEAP